jgi:ankyrin repeat protein
LYGIPALEYTALHVAAELGDVEILDLVFQACSTRGRSTEPKNIEGMTPLKVSAINYQLEAFTYLLQHGANPLDEVPQRAEDEAATSENSPGVPLFMGLCFCNDTDDYVKAILAHDRASDWVCAVDFEGIPLSITAL